MIQAGTPASPMCTLYAVATAPLPSTDNAEPARTHDTEDKVWDMGIANLNIQAHDFSGQGTLLVGSPRQFLRDLFRGRLKGF